MTRRVIAGLTALLMAQGFPPQVVVPVGKDAPSSVQVHLKSTDPAHVICDSGCGGAATFADNAAFTAGTTTVTNVGGVFNDSITALTSGSAGAPRLTSKRALHFNMRDNSGNEIPFPTALVSGGLNVNVNNASLAVTGTFWPATQPVSGTVAVSNAFALDATLTGGSEIAQVKSGLKGASAAALVTSTANGADHQGLDVQIQNATVAVTQSGAWSLSANQSTNVAQVAGTATDTNSGLKSGGTLRVVLATDQPALTNKLLVTPDSVALPANQSVNLAQVGGTASVNGGLAGTLAVGGTAASNAAINQNPVLTAGEALSTQPAAATTGNQRRITVSLDGAQYVRPGGPIFWTCTVSAQTVKKQCQAAPGANLKLYVTDVWWTNNSATATSAQLASGTGADCVTTTNAKTAAHTIPVSGAGSNVWMGGMTIPIALNANEILCTVPGGANSYSATISGYTAP